MKIPKTLKLPRKLKKELKKGVTKHTLNQMYSSTENRTSRVYTSVKFSGSGTKHSMRLCRFLLREEKKLFNKITIKAIKDMLNKFK